MTHQSVALVFSSTQLVCNVLDPDTDYSVRRSELAVSPGEWRGLYAPFLLVASAFFRFAINGTLQWIVSIRFDVLWAICHL